jgi:transcriptional regulator with XRE-family HTH domain
MPKSDVNAVFVRRLEQARRALGLSQAALGSRMGLPDETASTRINRYELGKSEPDLRTAQAVAKALGVSLSWLVCTDPKLAQMIEGFSRLKVEAKQSLLIELERALGDKTKLARAKVAAKKPTKRRPRVKG